MMWLYACKNSTDQLFCLMDEIKNMKLLFQWQFDASVCIAFERKNHNNMLEGT